MARKFKKQVKPLSEKAKMRIEIAKDALKQLNVWNVRTGRYCVFNKPLPENKNLKKILPKIQKECEVCAKGALFLSLVKKFNNVNTDDAEGTEYYDFESGDYNVQRIAFGQAFLESKLLKYFSEDQIDLIERAFEGWSKDSDYINYPMKYARDCSLVPDYALTYYDSTERLEVILKNIVRNKGKFVPELNDKGEVY